MRFFNTTGPCNPERHYMLPPEERLVGAQLSRYLQDELYWVLHAPRQTGKTTFLLDWMRRINAGGEAVACYVTVERCQGITDLAVSVPALCDAVRESAKDMGLPVPVADGDSSASRLSAVLKDWAAKVAPKPLIVLFDEVDTLEGETMVSFLRQLRGGFAIRGVGQFPTSIAMVGMRDLRDYLTQAKDGASVRPGSPFNIKADSATLGNFTKENVAALFAQRTAENGQQIAPDALDYVWEQSQGQPWIVNNLFMRATLRVLDATSTETVTIAHIQEARRQMILARETHLDSLAVRIDDPRIRKIMDTLIAGEMDLTLADSEAFQQCLDLGLVSMKDGTPQVANPIYREVLARQMTFGMQAAVPKPEWQWKKADGSLDMDALLKEFQKFWRRNGDIWEDKVGYSEAFPHLLLMAFLQRIVNGGGRIDREYAAGRGRLDLLVEYNHQTTIIEVKIVHSYDSPKAVREEGLGQIRRYRDTVAPQAPAYLVVFDRRHVGKVADAPTWESRITWETVGDVTVVGGYREEAP
jgi:hypothetical protein